MKSFRTYIGEQQDPEPYTKYGHNKNGILWWVSGSTIKTISVPDLIKKIVDNQPDQKGIPASDVYHADVEAVVARKFWTRTGIFARIDPQKKVITIQGYNQSPSNIQIVARKMGKQYPDFDIAYYPFSGAPNWLAEGKQSPKP